MSGRRSSLIFNIVGNFWLKIVYFWCIQKVIFRNFPLFLKGTWEKSRKTGMLSGKIDFVFSRFIRCSQIHLLNKYLEEKLLGNLILKFQILIIKIKILTYNFRFFKPLLEGQI